MPLLTRTAGPLSPASCWRPPATPLLGFNLALTPSPPPLSSSSGSCLSLPSIPSALSSPSSEGSLFSVPPTLAGLPAPGPWPSQMLPPGPPPPRSHLALLWSPLSVFPSDQILGWQGFAPVAAQAQEWLWGGPWLPASLSLTPSLPPVWLAVQPPLPSPHLSNHRATSASC